MSLRKVSRKEDSEKLEDYLLNEAGQSYENNPKKEEVQLIAPINKGQSPDEFIANHPNLKPYIDNLNKNIAANAEREEKEKIHNQIKESILFKPRGLASNAVNEPPEILTANADIGYGNVYSKVNTQAALDNYFNKRGNNPLQAVNVGANLNKDLGIATVGVRGNAQLGTDNSTVGYNVRVPIANSNINYETDTIRGTDIPTQHVSKLGLDSKDIAGIKGLAASISRYSSQYNDSPKEVRELAELRYEPNKDVTFFASKNKFKVDGDVVNKGNRVGAEYRFNKNGTISLTNSSDDSINGGKSNRGLSFAYKF